MPGAGARVHRACGVTDMRKGIAGLAALAEEVLKLNPASGAVVCHRGRRGDRPKLLFRKGPGGLPARQGAEAGAVPLAVAGGTARLTSARLAMPWEGIDWRRPNWRALPARVG